MVKLNKTNEDLPLLGVKKITILFYMLGMLKIFMDGDGWGVVFRWWHPFNWVLFLICTISCIFFEGTILAVFREMFCLNSYWKKRKKEIRYFKLSHLKYYK